MEYLTQRKTHSSRILVFVFPVLLFSRLRSCTTSRLNLNNCGFDFFSIRITASLKRVKVYTGVYTIGNKKFIKVLTGVYTQVSLGFICWAFFKHEKEAKLFSKI